MERTGSGSCSMANLRATRVAICFCHQELVKTENEYVQTSSCGYLTVLSSVYSNGLKINIKHFRIIW